MSGLETWVLAHISILAPLLVALADFAFAINPKLESNGLIHWAYLQLKSLTGGSSQPPAK